MLQLQLDPVPFEAISQLMHLGLVEAPRDAGLFATFEARASASGERALGRLGLSPNAEGQVERPRLLAALRAIAVGETVLTLEVDGDTFSFVAHDEDLVPATILPGGFIVGEAVHVSQVVKRMKQLLESDPDPLEAVALHVRGAQAVMSVWGGLQRPSKNPVSREDVETTLGRMGVPASFEEWLALAAAWLEPRDEGVGILPARQPLVTLLVRGKTVRLSRQEGFELVVDQELLGRAGKWVLVTRENEGQPDEVVGLEPTTSDATSALVDFWAGLKSVDLEAEPMLEAEVAEASTRSEI